MTIIIGPGLLIDSQSDKMRTFLFNVEELNNQLVESTELNKQLQTTIETLRIDLRNLNQTFTEVQNEKGKHESHHTQCFNPF